MNIDYLPIAETVENMTPEQRAWFEELRQKPHLQDASDAELFLMLYAVGCLFQMITGARAFDRAEVRNILNFGETW